MILDTTYTIKEHRELIIDLVGEPYSFLQSWRMGGIGSKRMTIADVSPNMNQYINTIADINYANIELRAGGILIRINKGLKNFTWVIPFYQLVVYKINGSSIHAHGKFIHFEDNNNFKENKSFFKRLMDLKILCDQNYNFTNLN